MQCFRPGVLWDVSATTLFSHWHTLIHILFESYRGKARAKVKGEIEREIEREKD